MPTPSASRLATLRYAVLDECFARDPERPAGEPLPRFFKQDLLDLVNKRLKEAIPGTKAIAMRTLEKDIQDMQRLFGVKIVRYHEKKRAWYSYAQEGMTIRAGGLTGAESSKLTGALEICDRFAGNEGTKWLPWALALLRHSFHLDANSLKARRNQTEAQGWSIGQPHRFPSVAVLEHIRDGLHLGDWHALRLKDGTAISYLPEHLHSGRDTDVVCGMERRIDENGEPMLVMRVLDWLEIETIEHMSDADHFKGTHQGRSWPQWCAHRFAVRPGEWSTFREWNAAPEEVRIWFSQPRAQQLQFRPWHASQSPRVEAAAGGQIFTFLLVADDALRSAVLAEARDAQLLEPLEMRNEIRDLMGVWPRAYDAMFGP